MGAWELDVFSVITQALESNIGIYPRFGQNQGDTFLDKTIIFYLLLLLAPHGF